MEHPIIQAPMAGADATPPGLVIAVSEAGGLGFIGAAYMSPAEIEHASRAVRSGTERPFGINLFVPVEGPPMPRDVKPALASVAPYHAMVGIASARRPRAEPLHVRRAARGGGGEWGSRVQLHLRRAGAGGDAGCQGPREYS